MDGELNCFTLVNVAVNSKSENISFLNLSQPVTRRTRIKNSLDYLWVSKEFRSSWGNIYPGEQLDVKKAGSTVLPSKEVFVALWITLRLYGSLSSFKRASGISELKKNVNRFQTYNEDKISNLVRNGNNTLGAGIEKTFPDLIWYDNQQNNGGKFASVKESTIEEKFRGDVFRVGNELIEELAGWCKKSEVSGLGQGTLFMKYNYKDINHIKMQTLAVNSVNMAVKEVNGFDVNSVKIIWEQSLYPEVSLKFVNTCNNIIKKRINYESKRHQYSTFDKYYHFVEEIGVLDEANEKMAKELKK